MLYVYCDSNVISKRIAIKLIEKRIKMIGKIKADQENKHKTDETNRKHIARW